MAGIFMPPILAREGVRFVGMEQLPTGLTRIVFSTPDEHGYVNMVKVTILAKGELTYTYAIHNAETQTTVYYSGKHGDPARDKVIDLDGHAF